MMHNPYWEEVQRFPQTRGIWGNSREVEWFEVSYEKLPYLTPEQQANIRHREHLCIQYAWSIPDPISLAFVSEHLGNTAIEIGAGVGYWAYCLAQLGTHVTCYDIAPPQRIAANHWHSPRKGRYEALTGELRHVWQEVYYGNHNKAKQYTYPLFLCWPPMSSMATQALKGYRGNTLVYIGEGSGGCTADDAFFALLDKEWESIADHRPVRWSGINDFIEVYTRA